MKPKINDLLSVGELHPPRTMFLRVHVGEAERGALKYEMSAGMNGSPIVHSKKTGKWFTLSWQDILNLAGKAGIDKPHTTKNPKLNDHKMKLTIPRETLAKAVSTAASPSLKSKTTLLILNNVLLTANADAGGFTIRSAGLDVECKSQAEAIIERAGGITLPSRKLNQIIGSFGQNPDVTIDVDEKKSNAKITVNGSEFNLLGLHVDEFPPETVVKGEHVNVTAGELRKVLKRCATVASTDESRHVLNGVYFGFDGDNVTAVATDGRRLIKMLVNCTIPKPFKREIIVPSASIAMIQSLISKLADDTEAVLTVGENRLRVEAGDSSLSTKLIEGNFPNYKQVIPAEAKISLDLDREEFHSALRRASLMTSEKANSIKLLVSKNQITISANSPDIGESREIVAVKYNGKDQSFAVNPDYIIDPLADLDTERVTLNLIDELSPGTFTIKEDPSYLYVVMPMRLS